MRRTAVLISIGEVLMLAGVAWLAAAQIAGESTVQSPAPAVLSVPVKVDLNRAGLEELGRLPGISPQLAERIVKNRPYRKLDDLVSRRVLGKKQFARVRELVMVSRVPP